MPRSNIIDIETFVKRYQAKAIDQIAKDIMGTINQVIATESPSSIVPTYIKVLKRPLLKEDSFRISFGVVFQYFIQHFGFKIATQLISITLATQKDKDEGVEKFIITMVIDLPTLYRFFILEGKLPPEREEYICKALNISPDELEKIRSGKN